MNVTFTGKTVIVTGAATGIGLVPWSPLAYGLLTGKYDRAAVAAAWRSASCCWANAG